MQGLHAENDSNDNIRPNIIHIWDGTSLNNKSVTLDVFLPQKKSNRPIPAIIICSGGSYCWHDLNTEGKLVAKWLNENGIAAFILNYRVQGVFNYVTHARYIFKGNRHPQMLQDGQRAIQYIREHKTQFNIDEHKLGVIGFSAGGHLAMSLAEFSGTNFLSLLGVMPGVSLRPDFVAPIYPVVTMNGELAHKRSRRALLGEHGKKNVLLRDSLSLEKHVPNDCPPVFLMNCKDDRVVKCRNSELLDSALTSKGIAHKYIQYKTGNHGFGASEKKGSAECRQWKSQFIAWLKQMNIIQ